MKTYKVQCPIDKDIIFELPESVEKDCKCETLENNKNCKMNMFGCYGCFIAKEKIKSDFKRFNEIAKKFIIEKRKGLTMKKLEVEYNTFEDQKFSDEELVEKMQETAFKIQLIQNKVEGDISLEEKLKHLIKAFSLSLELYELAAIAAKR